MDIIINWESDKSQLIVDMKTLVESTNPESAKHLFQFKFKSTINLVRFSVHG